MSRGKANKDTEKPASLPTGDCYFGVWLVARERWLEAGNGMLVNYPRRAVAFAHAQQLSAQNVMAEARPFEE